jgi:isopentenyl diphosphate isomerase/L-lactate dehydrogenase-like FMN-dependent dehydrogenase
MKQPPRLTTASLRAGGYHTLRLLGAGMRIAMALTGTGSVTDINANILMTARRRAIQQG